MVVADRAGHFCHRVVEAHPLVDFVHGLIPLVGGLLGFVNMHLCRDEMIFETRFLM